MTDFCFIGDVHGKFVKYQQILDTLSQNTISIQVGDFGVGLSSEPVPKLANTNHYFIRGNHDCLSQCLTTPNFIQDGQGLPEFNLWALGGGFSIDRNLRTENVDWWSDEECSWYELHQLIAGYEQQQPQIVVSHCCPQQVLTKALMKNYPPSRTTQALAACFDCHQPRLWVFGHYHINFDFYYNTTHFIGVRTLDHKIVSFR